ncbi:hypothetical protein FSP39_009423 [Pinctada imbricata]|uniref:Ig-like domain-containing protein n=1 Tax=Pinctada imbricata TaxID=66713 RepID=A0AA89C5P0_PINIB|nr:hypothetical protein FSP39_009423 [Pinctada imbricata]
MVKGREGEVRGREGRGTCTRDGQREREGRKGREEGKRGREGIEKRREEGKGPVREGMSLSHIQLTYSFLFNKDRKSYFRRLSLPVKYQILILDFLFEDVSSVTLTADRIPSTTDIQIGGNQVQFRCTYTHDGTDNTFLVEWQKESPRGSGSFNTIALFNKPNGAGASFSTSEEGLLFQNRSTLTNPSSSSLTAILSVNTIQCDDEGLYRCKYTYLDTTGVKTMHRDVSLDTSAPGDTPYTKPTMSKTAGTIEEGDSITFTCTANVGKPMGRIRWWKYRSSVNSASEIVAPSPSPPAVVPGVCEYNVTSTMTTQLTKDDNNARIRCSVDQDLIPGSTPENKAFMETEAINVFYRVGVPTIIKNPNSNEYQVGENLLDLTCSVEGNPNPATSTDKNVNNFTWHYKSSDGDNETMATDVNNVVLINGGRTIRISSLIEDQAGIYICQAQNGFNNQVFTEKTQVQVTIVKTTTTTTTTPATSPSSPANTPTPAGQGGGGDDSGLGGGIIAAIVIVVIVVIVLIVVAIVCFVMKRRNKDDSIEEPSEKPRNNHLTTVNQTNMLNEKNSPFYQPSNQYEKNYNKQDLQYADLTFDNKPRSRNPMVLNEIDTSNMDNHSYSQVMMPSV